MMHPGRFKDQVMVVTGAAQGIGRGVALAAAGEGARLVLADRSPLVHEVAREAAALGALVVVVEADLETWAGASKLAARALEDYGGIDILVNNVGGTIWAKPYQEYAEAEIEAEIRRSLFPTLWCCRAVLPVMMAARKVPRNPNPLSAQEQAWYQGIVDQTRATSLMHRYGSIAEQVAAILFLASNEASYITGTVLPVAGGDQG
jgi:dihydroxycyclohexadiene carboxylate dehydrogenase